MVAESPESRIMRIKPSLLRASKDLPLSIARIFATITAVCHTMLIMSKTLIAMTHLNRFLASSTSFYALVCTDVVVDIEY